VNGSSKLTPEQQEWYVQKFGRRYLYVQQTPQVPPRRVRRRLRKARD
jgi:hypothetical protein